ncbi:hypothetical protein SAMN05444266_10628 [Chitinophaga jiangningensis]|uniref:Uncharacterized protein n=1 Tax=Chitinophaga jiangningensis TaxID=1419482 RepID=A0A1M7F7N4_9BACT|nr:hypothetical protein SAMN05444266_10628 [Chitinophaga jiangningensis]
MRYEGNLISINSDNYLRSAIYIYYLLKIILLCIITHA